MKCFSFFLSLPLLFLEATLVKFLWESSSSSSRERERSVGKSKETDRKRSLAVDSGDSFYSFLSLLFSNLSIRFPFRSLFPLFLGHDKSRNWEKAIVTKLSLSRSRLYLYRFLLFVFFFFFFHFFWLILSSESGDLVGFDEMAEKERVSAEICKFADLMPASRWEIWLFFI